MEVTIEPFIGQSMATREEVRFNQYRIRVDGMTSGYVGFQPGSKVMLTRIFGPVERKQIEADVAALLERESIASSQAPDVPPELLNPPEELADDDDLDA